MIIFYGVTNDCKRVKEIHMGNTKLISIIVLIVLMIIGIASCTSYEGEKKEFETYREITPDEFAEAVYNIYGVEVESEYKENSGYHILDCPWIEVQGVRIPNTSYRIYDNSEDARSRFEDYYCRYIVLQEEDPDEVETVFLEDRGYIIYDDYYQSRIVSEIGSDLFVGETYDTRVYGCIYYYDSIIIYVDAVGLQDSSAILAIEFLEELGLPYMPLNNEE